MNYLKNTSSLLYDTYFYEVSDVIKEKCPLRQLRCNFIEIVSSFVFFFKDNIEYKILNEKTSPNVLWKNYKISKKKCFYTNKTFYYLYSFLQ